MKHEHSVEKAQKQRKELQARARSLLEVKTKLEFELKKNIDEKEQFTRRMTETKEYFPNLLPLIDHVRKRQPILQSAVDSMSEMKVQTQKALDHMSSLVTHLEGNGKH